MEENFLSAPLVEEKKPVKVESNWQVVGEFVGTFLLVFLGCSTCAMSKLGGVSLFEVGVAWGLTLAFVILIVGDLSGAHVNPAMTVCFRLYRPSSISAAMAAKYVASQFLGATFGALVVMLTSGPALGSFERHNDISRGDSKSILSAAGLGCYFPNPGANSRYVEGGFFDDTDVGFGLALVVEIVGTALLAFAVFAFTHPNNHSFGKEKASVPFSLGAVLALLVVLFGPLTLTCLNPARDFGPRFVTLLFGWGRVAFPGPKFEFVVYLAGPMIGAPLGAAVSDLLLFADRKY